MRQYRYFAPKTLAEVFDVVAAQSDAEVKFLAGGTDLTPKINLEREQIPYEEKAPMAIVYLGNLGLSGIREEGDTIRIGAATPIVDIQDSELLRRRVPALCQAASVLASFAVRNCATLAGNIINASPAADMVPPLMVLDAEVVLCSAGGSRSMKVADFMTGPGTTAIAPNEVVTEIVVRPGKGHAAFEKLGRRAAETLSVVNAAAYVEVENGICTKARIAVGSAAPTCKLCQAAAEALVGQTLTEEGVKAAMTKVNEVLVPIDDIRASAWYRLETAPVLAARAVLAAAAMA